MQLDLRPAESTDAGGIFALRHAVAVDLTERFGKGYWSSFGTEARVERGLRSPTTWIALRENVVIAMLHLGARKPWAIDASYFARSQRPLYLTSMAVLPALQGQGIGRACLREADRIATRESADAIRLDAFDADAGAGAFYARTGYREVGRVVYRKTPLVYYERLL